MRVAFLFSRMNIPVDLTGVLLHLVSVDIVEMDFPALQMGDLFILQVVDCSRVFQYGRYVRGDKSGIFCCPHNQRAVFSRRKNFPGAVRKQNSQRIGSFQTAENRGNGFQRIPLIIIVEKVDYHLCICIGDKFITLFHQILFVIQIILNNTVMYNRNRFVFVGVRMRIAYRRLPVRRPAGMSDTAGSRKRGASVRLVIQYLQMTDRLRHIYFFSVIHCQSRGIIAAVFQLLQPVQKNGRRLSLSGKSNYSTHIN